MTLFELHTINENNSFINRDEWERLRLQTYLLKQQGYVRKNLSEKEFMPFEYEKFKGSTEADPKMIEWWNKVKDAYKKGESE